ncbi:phage terminase large subunit [Ovoidimarina sediminis]|uniref:phage terminase large subunit n=1 Tax=Ovoidimarina sediminis TaxID=3079856 RepID=UPI00290B36AD|nr:phage terminase large subunit [Rhodophyticola sp. MJ-SS7]MDU8946603.1 phage terminase large subunit [Rhodophyticola sp. MJ-SS7]
MIPNDDVYRILIHSRLRAFLGRSFRSLNPGKQLSDAYYLRGLCHALERVERGEIQRLIIEVAPRHLKSTIASIVYPAWVIGRDPTKRVVCVSYSNDLAQSFSYKCRSLMQEPLYKSCFPAMQFDQGKNAVTEFHTLQKGFRLATSMQGGITGKGGDLVVIDDPMKAQDTYSEAARDAVFETYQTTIATRLDDQKTGAIVIVGQRLHEDDLLGRLKQSGTWEVLSYPALAIEEQIIDLGDDMVFIRQPNDPLDPRRIGREELEKIRAEIGNLAFEAEYQQRPVLPGGNLIKLEWFKAIDQPLERAQYEAVIQSWDTAAVPGESNDYTVCTTWGIIGPHVDLLDVFRKQLLYPEILQSALVLREKWKPNLIVIEKAVTGLSLKPDLNRIGVLEAFWLPPEKGKVERMIAQSAKIEGGQVRLPKAAHFLEAFKAEVAAFPKGKYDDQVDSMSQVLRALDIRHHTIRHCSRFKG